MSDAHILLCSEQSCKNLHYSILMTEFIYLLYELLFISSQTYNHHHHHDSRNPRGARFTSNQYEQIYSIASWKRAEQVSLNYVLNRNFVLLRAWLMGGGMRLWLVPVDYTQQNNIWLRVLGTKRQLGFQTFNGWDAEFVWTLKLRRLIRVSSQPILVNRTSAVGNSDVLGLECVAVMPRSAVYHFINPAYL